MSKKLPDYKPGQSPADYYDSCLAAGWTEQELDYAFNDDFPESDDAITELDVFEGDPDFPDE